MRVVRKASAAFHGAIHFALVFALLQVGAFVLVRLAADQGQLNFCNATVREIDCERDDRESSLSDLCLPLSNLAAVQEEAALARGGVLIVSGHGIRRYVAISQENVALANHGEGFVERSFPVT